MPEGLVTLIPKINSRRSIQHDMAHGLNIFLGRIRDGRGLLSNGLFLRLTGALSRMRPELLSLLTRNLEATQHH